MEFSGTVNEASLSNMYIFPSFRGWYRDNVYLAPLTLITVMLGSISLLRVSPKKPKTNPIIPAQNETAEKTNQIEVRHNDI